MDWFLHGGSLRLEVVVAIASGLRSLCVLQLVAGYLGLALDFVWGGAGFNFYWFLFFSSFLLVLVGFCLGGGES